ncbi:hypothetical protein [Acidisphaera sp. S103]|uniref:hypothetical protein n=1 Tax=Acidisphaera sp. S103 TaxID=1747223 RepID=UPI00131C87DA|nr:hypothetical protein [Acidisphaera sp. S103]
MLFWPATGADGLGAQHDSTGWRFFAACGVGTDAKTGRQACQTVIHQIHSAASLRVRRHDIEQFVRPVGGQPAQQAAGGCLGQVVLLLEHQDFPCLPQVGQEFVPQEADPHDLPSDQFVGGHAVDVDERMVGDAVADIEHQVFGVERPQSKILDSAHRGESVVEGVQQHVEFQPHPPQQAQRLYPMMPLDDAELTVVTNALESMEKFRTHGDIP